MLAGYGYGAVVHIARAQEGKINVKAQIMALQTKGAFKNATGGWTEITDEYLLSALTAFHMMWFQFKLIVVVINVDRCRRLGRFQQ